MLTVFVCMFIFLLGLFVCFVSNQKTVSKQRTLGACFPCFSRRCGEPSPIVGPWKCSGIVEISLNYFWSVFLFLFAKNETPKLRQRVFEFNLRLSCCYCCSVLLSCIQNPGEFWFWNIVVVVYALWGIWEKSNINLLLLLFFVIVIST